MRPLQRRLPGPAATSSGGGVCSRQVVTAAVVSVLILGAVLLSDRLLNAGPPMGTGGTALKEQSSLRPKRPAPVVTELESELTDALLGEKDAATGELSIEELELLLRIKRKQRLDAARRKKQGKAKGKKEAPAAEEEEEGAVTEGEEQEEDADAEAAARVEEDVVYTTAVAWTRLRQTAFQQLVLKGGTVGSSFPEHIQKRAFEFEPAFQDPSKLAKLGLMLTPYYMYTASYVLAIQPAVMTWMQKAANSATVEALRQELTRGGDSTELWNKWDPLHGVTGWRVILAEEGVQPPAALTAAWVHAHTAAIDPIAHARSTLECALENAIPGKYEDYDRMLGSLRSQQKYPKVIDPFAARDHKGIMAALFESPATQPLPRMLTIFDAALTRLGLVYADYAPRTAMPAAYGLTLDQVDSSFKNIQCMHEGHNMDRVDQHHVVDEVIVLAQFWGDNVFHHYQEDFIRLSTVLDFIRAHPNIQIHVHGGKWMEGQNNPRGVVRGTLEALGIDPNRAVADNVRAKIVYLPDGMPCGEPYMLPQLAVRDMMRTAVGRKPVFDLFGSGVLFKSGMGRDTEAPPPKVARASAEYAGATLQCILKSYKAKAGATHPMLQQSSVPQQLRDAATGADAGPLADAVRAYIPIITAPAGSMPRVVVIKRISKRAVHNFDALESALRQLPVSLDILDEFNVPTQRDVMLKFAGADVVVAPHGAGLTNILACWPGTKILEFLTESYQLNMVYTQMGLSLGYQYHSMVPAGGQTDGGMFVDAGQAQGIVRDAIAAQ